MLIGFLLNSWIGSQNKKISVEYIQPKMTCSLCVPRCTFDRGAIKTNRMDWGRDFGIPANSYGQGEIISSQYTFCVYI